MKNIIFGMMVAGIFSVCHAQVPDSTRKIKSPEQFRTDSVKHGNEVYNGNNSRKSKSNGDTLTKPRNTKKSGSQKNANNTK